MSDTRAHIKAHYPLPSYNYRVAILHGHAAESIGFSEVTGLSIAYEPVTYKDGLSFMMGETRVPGMAKPINLTLKKGLARNSDYLQKWMDAAYRQPFSQGAKRDVLIDLCDETGHPVVRWKVSAAMPTKLDAPAFVANGNELAIASMDLIAAKLHVEFQP